MKHEIRPTVIGLLALCASVLPWTARAQEEVQESAVEAQAAPAPAESAPIASAAPPPEPVASEGSIRDTSPHRRPMALSALAYVPWWYGIGAGFSAAFEIPVVHDGFIPSVNDQFSIEPSFSFAYTTWRGTLRGYDEDHALMFRPAVAAVWSFHFSNNLRAYAAVNIGYTRVNRSFDLSGRSVSYGYNHFYGELNVGMFYNVHQRVSLRAELGFYGMRAGVAFLL